MAGEPDLTKVLDSIYFAPHGGSGWCDCLNLICELVRGDAARLLRIDKQTEQVVAELPGQNLAGQAGDSDFQGANSGALHGRFVADGLVVELKVQRVGEGDPFTPRDRSVLDELMPHIARALRQDGASRVLKDRQAAVSRPNQGALLLLNAQQDVVFVSTRAKDWLSQTSRMTLKDNHLYLSGYKKQTEFSDLVRYCMGQRGSGMMALPEKTGVVRLLVSFEEAGIDGIFESNGLIAVFILAIDSEDIDDEGAIARWLGLTEQEARIATRIAQGGRPADIAAALGVSLHTVRHHLKNIYRKTGTHSQSQLTAMVLNLPL